MLQAGMGVLTPTTCASHFWLRYEVGQKGFSLMTVVGVLDHLMGSFFLPLGMLAA